MFSKHLSMLDLPLPILPSTLTTNGFVLVSCSMTFAESKDKFNCPISYRQNTFGQSYFKFTFTMYLFLNKIRGIPFYIKKTFAGSKVKFNNQTPLVNNASFPRIKFTFTLSFLLCWKYEIRGPSLVRHNIQVSQQQQLLFWARTNLWQTARTAK